MADCQRPWTCAGAKVEWDGASKTVKLTSGGHSIAMTVGSSEALVDGNSTVPAAPLLVGGKALIPLAFTAEQLGWEVTTDKKGTWIRYSLTP